MRSMTNTNDIRKGDKVAFTNSPYQGTYTVARRRGDNIYITGANGTTSIASAYDLKVIF